MKSALKGWIREALIRFLQTLCFDTFIFPGIILSLCITQKEHFTRSAHEQETAGLIKETSKATSQNPSHLDFNWRKLLLHFITMYVNLWKEWWIGILIPTNLLKWIQFVPVYQESLSSWRKCFIIPVPNNNMCYDAVWSYVKWRERDIWYLKRKAEQ